ncbi:unnamed protein product [Blepharisma stoltei]|uniref:Uncharacterized protein n=1 Tax=Blepharisma stoltei TaxID=1481888 RepID=A0AAU9J635_9CILI|nr:unnamed protein product [Blepharisma stoltei]
MELDRILLCKIASKGWSFNAESTSFLNQAMSVSIIKNDSNTFRKVSLQYIFPLIGYCKFIENLTLF